MKRRKKKKPPEPRAIPGNRPPKAKGRPSLLQRQTVGYIRVSSREQAETKLSLIHQEEKIKAWAVAQDLELRTIFNDAAESAKDLKRPAVRELLAEVEKGLIDHVIIYKLDRFIRNVGDLSDLLRLFERKNVALSAVVESLDTSTASGKMVVQMIGVIAEWERDTIAERTKAALDVKRRRGEKLGGKLPYGYRARKGKLVVHPKEQRVLKAILKAHQKAKKGYTEIAESLNDKGERPRNGKRWYASTIRAICQREGGAKP